MKTENIVRPSRRALLIGLLTSLALTSGVAVAGGGGAGGGATEITQLLNNVQLAESYAQQVVSYQNQLMQYSTMVQNLTKNPIGVLLPDVQKAADNMSRLMSIGHDIASNMSRVDQNFANTFKSPTAQTFATKFSLWTNSSQDALKAAMLNAGLQREQFADDASSLQALTNDLASQQGNVAALQSLGALNARQIQESMKLRDLISQQQVAQNTYLAAQASKEQMRTDATEINFEPGPRPDKNQFKNPKF